MATGLLNEPLLTKVVQNEDEKIEKVGQGHVFGMARQPMIEKLPSVIKGDYQQRIDELENATVWLRDFVLGHLQRKRADAADSVTDSRLRLQGLLTYYYSVMVDVNCLCAFGKAVIGNI